MRLPFTALLLLSLILLSGCDQDKPRPGTRTVRLNPSPQHAYQLTLTLEDAPGPFALVEGFVQYDATNASQCGYTQRYTGITENVREILPFEFNKVSNTEYIGTIYTDHLIDEDYYGKDLCHWTLTVASAKLRATEDTNETLFIIGIHPDEMYNHDPETRYYWKGGYPRSQMDRYSDFGSHYPEKFKPELRNDLFSIILTSKEYE